MRKLISMVDHVLSWTLIIAMLSILLAVVWQVISRYLLSDPASFTEELSRFLLIWIGILGAAFAYRKKAHLGFNMLVERQSATTQRWLLTAVEAVVIVFSASTLVYGGNELVALTLDLNQISASLGIKMGLIYSVLPIAGVLFIFYAAISIWNLWRDEAQEPL